MVDHSEVKLTPDDTYSVARIYTMRDNIRETIRKTSHKAKYMDLELDDGVWGMDSDDVIDELVPIFAGSLGVDGDVVHQSLHSLLRGPEVHIDDVDTVAWIMAGNVQKLKAGEPVEPFINVTHAEWVPSFVVDYQRCYRYGKRGGVFSFLVTGGSPCTKTLKDFYSEERGDKTIYLLRHVFGLPAWGAKKLRRRDFVGMKGWLYLDTDVSQERGKPTFSHIECHPTFRSHNRKLLRRRLEPCDLDPTLTRWDCCECPAGLESCERATHRYNYVQKDCAKCGHPSFFESEEGELCVSCQERIRLNAGKKRR